MRLAVSQYLKTKMICCLVLNGVLIIHDTVVLVIFTAVKAH